VVGTGGFVTYSKGPTAPDQPAYGVTGSEDTTNGQYDRIFPGGFFNQSSNLHAHYDIERQATWAEVNPAVSGTGGYNLDGVTYLAYQRKKDWVDICEYLRSIGGLGQFFWQPCHSVRQQTFDDFYAAVSQVPTTATSRPVYGSGSIVYSQAFPTNGAVPSEVTAYADVGFWNGPNASLVSVVNNRLQIQTTVSPQKNYTTAIVNFSGLTVGHLYAVFFDVITDANSMLDAWVQDAANFAGNNLPDAHEPDAQDVVRERQPGGHLRQRRCGRERDREHRQHRAPRRHLGHVRIGQCIFEQFSFPEPIRTVSGCFRSAGWTAWPSRASRFAAGGLTQVRLRPLIRRLRRPRIRNGRSYRTAFRAFCSFISSPGRPFTLVTRSSRVIAP
jgi:hypothetical protein